MRRLSVVLLSAIVTSACASAPPRALQPDRPPLVVVLVVDQLRSGYIETLGPRFTAGFRRLLDGGARFPNAAYPYLNTVTCAGHATIATGALPYRHGMVLNAWWDRAAARSMPCTTDESTKNIGYMGKPTGGDSAATLLVPTLADHLQAAGGGRSVSISLKQRSAITMAGRRPNAVVWFDGSAGWATSLAFTDSPVGWVQSFVDANPIGADRGKRWERLLPPEAYDGIDDGEGEFQPSGWGRVFPHVLGEPANQFLVHWQRSPLADAYLGRMAAHAVDSLQLGRGPGTDILSVSFSTLDLVGHQYGPASHEAQDILFRLDQTIGTLLAHLDARLGRDGYVLALSSDHGIADLPEQAGGGRQSSTAIVAAIDDALAPFFGPGKYVAQTVYTDIYLQPGVFDRLRASAPASAAVLHALEAMPGIARAFRADEISLAAVRSDADPEKRAAALSYYAPRSGDILVVPARNWLLSSAATTHGTLHPYDQRVPVLFFGAGVAAGIHDGPVTPADIAPTLAALVGAAFKAPDGSPLLRRPSPVSIE